ncbi:hypothetical protein HAP94_00145 [Acidithiobacillus ferrivorans]|nr:hypothetical protein [Acidithiobacillus ferrivorans]
MTATAMSMPFSNASAIAERLLNVSGHEHSRMKTKLMSYLDTNRGDRVNLPAPALLRRIADAIGCSSPVAARLVQAMENQNLRAAITFQPAPATLGDLVLWDVVHDFFEEKCRGRSEKSAWTKAIYGQKLKAGGRKPGLADTLGEIPALAAFYMLFNGLKGVNRVINIAGWTWEYIKELLATATRGINLFIKEIGNTLLKILEKGSYGMMFAVSLMGALVTGKKAKKITKVQKVIGVDAAASNDDEDENDDNFTFENAHPDPDNEPDHDPDLQDEDSKAAAPDGFDDPEDQDNVDKDDPDEPPKTPRAVAFHLLESTRMRLKRARGRTQEDQRLLDLLNLVDPPVKMIDALQKGTAGPADTQISQRMADCLSLAWQWAHKTGIFASIPKHKKYLDMTPSQFLATLIAGVRDGYLTPDETPKPPKPKHKKGEKREADGDDPGREWIPVMDWETGRVARVTRNTPPVTITIGISTQIQGNDEIVATFLHHIKMNLPFKKRKKFNAETTRLRFWVATSIDGSTQVITCEKETHLPKKSIENAVDDIESFAPIDGPGNDDESVFDLDGINIQEDLITFGDYQDLARILKITPTVIRAGLTGDNEAMAEIHETIRALSPAMRAAAQDMVVRMLRLDQDNIEEINQSCRLAG